MKNYIEEVSKCKNNMIYVDLDNETLNRIDDFVKRIIQRKQYEQHHIIDSGQEYKRFYTGIMGECAIEQLFKCKFIDWSIGDSKDYNTADLRSLGMNVGIKTVELRKFPIIHKIAHRPELICIKRTPKIIILCGLATIDVLNAYQDDELIISPLLRSRGTKTGFYGFEHLIKISSLHDLKKMI